MIYRFRPSIACVLMLACIVLTSCWETPTTCVQLCDKVEEWTRVCNAPLLPGEVCRHHFLCNSSTCGDYTLLCWNLLMAWHPTLDSEVDCTKPPPSISSRGER